jgi:chemotaxis protein CheC
MTLTDEQADAVTELVNIAFARTAAALSDLAGDRVELNVPEIETVSIQDLAGVLAKFVRGDVATVHQIFGGPMSGDAFLLLDLEGASRLVAMLTDADAPVREMGASDREVLAEVGNILLNACLSVFGDLLQVRFTFAVPRLQLDSLRSMIASLLVDQHEIRHAVIVGTRFAVRSSNVTGCLVLVLSVTSLEKFVAAVEEWAERSAAGGDDR